jgi:hypothetical protein
MMPDCVDAPEVLAEADVVEFAKVAEGVGAEKTVIDDPRRAGDGAEREFKAGAHRTKGNMDTSGSSLDSMAAAHMNKELEEPAARLVPAFYAVAG